MGIEPNSVGQAHASTGFVPEINANTQEVCRAGGFAALTAHTVLCAGRGGDLARLAAVPGDHFEDVEGASAHTLRATDAGVVDLDGVGHVPVPMRMT